MSIIEEIKRDVPHDEECPARSGSVNNVRGILRDDYVPPECNCSRRRKIARLERLLKPAAFAVRYKEPDEGRDAPNWVGIWNERHIAEDMQRRATRKREPLEVVAVCIRPLE